jgi:glyoxalase family protein
MGMRLVKRSVNQDAPDTYHLFYADSTGTPGTDLTFFPWPSMPPMTPGVGLAMEVTFAVAQGSLDWWRDWLRSRGSTPGDEEIRFGERVIAFKDPHGLSLALVETERQRVFSPWEGSEVPRQHQLRGMDSVRIWERDTAATASFLTGVLGFEVSAEEEGWTRFSVAAGEAGTSVDVREVAGAARGRWGTGCVHHVAWRVADVDEQMEVRAAVEEAGRRPTPQIDRFWFKSVYFLEPGGVLFELATDGPGFERDESLESLGDKLILPPWLEPIRSQIERGLPLIQV